MRARILLGALLFSAAMIFLVLSPRPAMAATCYGSSCDGQSPSATGCSSDASVVSSAKIYDDYGGWIGTIYHLWSATCQAGYGETVTLGFNASYITAQMYVSSTVNYLSYDHNLPRISSPMLSSSPSNLSVCGNIRMGAVGSSPTGGACTP